MAATADSTQVLNEVPEHMAQEWVFHFEGIELSHSSMKFLSTWLRNTTHFSVFDSCPANPQ